MPATALLRVHGLHVAFGDVIAVADLDLEVRPGTCVALVGHNGSGKSTVVACLGGQLTPSSGSIEFGGPSGSGDHVAPARRAIVPDPALDGDGRTVRERLTAVAAAAAATDDTVDAAVDAVLNEFGLVSRQHAEVHQLSRGLQQRAQLACAFVQPVDLLVIDEPTRYLDLRAAGHLVDRLIDELARGAGVLLTTHDAELVRALADEVLVLEDGRTVARGAPDDVLASEAAVRAGLTLPGQ